MIFFSARLCSPTIEFFYTEKHATLCPENPLAFLLSMKVCALVIQTKIYMDEQACEKGKIACVVNQNFHG